MRSRPSNVRELRARVTAITRMRLRETSEEVVRRSLTTRADATELVQVVVQIGRLQIRDARAAVAARSSRSRP